MNPSNHAKELFIFDNINELPLEGRREILQIIYNSQFRSKITEKGSGVQIKISDLNQVIFDKIYKTIYNKINDKNNNII